MVVSYQSICPSLSCLRYFNWLFSFAVVKLHSPSSFATPKGSCNYSFRKASFIEDLSSPFYLKH